MQIIKSQNVHCQILVPSQRTSLQKLLQEINLHGS